MSRSSSAQSNPPHNKPTPYITPPIHPTHLLPSREPNLDRDVVRAPSLPHRGIWRRQPVRGCEVPSPQDADLYMFMGGWVCWCVIYVCVERCIADGRHACIRGAGFGYFSQPARPGGRRVTPQAGRSSSSRHPRRPTGRPAHATRRAPHTTHGPRPLSRRGGSTDSDQSELLTLTVDGIAPSRSRRRRRRCWSLHRSCPYVHVESISGEVCLHRLALADRRSEAYSASGSV